MPHIHHSETSVCESHVCGNWKSQVPQVSAVLIRPTLKIFFVSSYLTLFLWVRQSEFFFLTFQIGYSLNLIVHSKTCLKRPLRKKTKIVCFFKTDYRIMQVKSIAECSQGAFCNTLDLHLAPICLNDLCCVYIFKWSF